MIEKIAMWGGVAGIIISVIAIIILLVLRGNVLNILDKDTLMYDKNYELKKDALQRAFDCLDHVSQNGAEIKNNPQYIQVAKEAYNALLCTVYSPKIYQEFYRLAIDKMEDNYTIEDIEKFKIACRVELLGRKKKSNEIFKGSVVGGLNNGSLSGNSRTNMRPQPQQPPMQSQPPRPIQPQNNNMPQGQPQRPQTPPPSQDGEE